MAAEHIITTFYKFVQIKDVEVIRLQLYKACRDEKILGTILLADEGINATIVGSRNAIDAFYAVMNSISEFVTVDYKETLCHYLPFSKLKVKVKPEVIKFNVDNTDAVDEAGERLSYNEWEQLLDNGAPIIDTRNDYEVVFGTFKNAINPRTRNFTDIVQWIESNLKNYDHDQPIGMFCTGGVRCEKSTAYLKKLGFKKVYHLDGGIIKYLMNTRNKNGYWQGKCFVFDDRVAIDENLQPYAKPLLTAPQ